MARLPRALVLALTLIATPSAFTVPPSSCFTRDMQKNMVCGAICKYADSGSFCEVSPLNPRPAYCYRVLDVTPTTCHEGQYDKCCEGSGSGF